MKGLFEELNEKEKTLYNAKRDLLSHKVKIYRECPFLWKYTANVDGVRQNMAGVYATKEDAEMEFNKWSSSTFVSVSDPQYFQVESTLVPLDEIKRAFFYYYLFNWLQTTTRSLLDQIRVLYPHNGPFLSRRRVPTTSLVRS